MAYQSPDRGLGPPVVLSPWSRWSIGAAIMAAGAGAPAAASTPQANRTILVPFFMRKPGLVRKLWCLNGSAAAGSVDVGVLSRDLATLIVSAGSTGQAGTTVIQSFDVTDTWLPIGKYYMGVSWSSGTASFFRWSGTVQHQKTLGIAWVGSGPAIAAAPTIIVPGAAYLPVFGLAFRTTI